ncbi:thioredoxin peroxidase [Halobacteriovorax marinus]|uniref:Thioredoxin peroxidase n=1 Tax=Halobacteriovorax marinus TaxID=97084 RepID=A0A1Y5F4D2_9BACT|nr:thioredoxin peroxidase [Halobacteriovorax marinus]
MDTCKFTSGKTLPNIKLPFVGGGHLTLGVPQGDNDWQMIVVYRGQFCPICKGYLKSLEEMKNKFYELNVDIVVVSADSKGSATKFKEENQLTFPVAHDLHLEQMKELGLYISSPRSIKESDHPFSEPALFVVNKERKVQVIDISNAPFTRPDLNSLVSGLAYIRNPKVNYPIRGTFVKSLTDEEYECLY